ncbi:MAG: sulfite exporter TauE/SafE family protein [Chloroflexi bacterium]|nr:sulfite exporter TauE/SafE family protein [Chloroflexota bacterium]MCI0889234.1 sulfite exporter TauE/SafE family protein [Chloroflexota bacterium]
MLEILALLLIGFIGGFAGGLLGIGGGAIYVPAMVLILDEQQHLAQGASLAAIIATAAVGGYTHFRQQNVDVRTVMWVAPVAVITGFAAALLADSLDASTLRRVFAVVSLYFALTMIIGALRQEPATNQEQEIA